VSAAEDRSTRGDRILDAAADLLLRHGYHRVTIEDVARAAGIGKGTIYLHWRTREELFTAALVRDFAAALDAMADLVEADPDAWRLHAMARATYLTIMQRPLLTAVVRSDPEVLGRLSGGDLAGRYRRRVTLMGRYFAMLHEAGILRDDLSVEDIGLAFRATYEGFLMIDALERGSGAPEDAAAGVERSAELLAATVRSAFESGREVPRRMQQAIRQELAAELRAVAAADRAGLDRSGTVPAPSHPEASVPGR
jgi:AcrR family transcriptional regulator